MEKDIIADQIGRNHHVYWLAVLFSCMFCSARHDIEDICNTTSLLI